VDPKLWIAAAGLLIRRWFVRWRDTSGRHHRRGRHEERDNDEG
jgi:hypothetical protein